ASSLAGWPETPARSPEQADLFHERRGIPIIRHAADLTGLQFEDGRAAHRRKALACGRDSGEVALVGAGHNPLDNRPLFGGKPACHAVFEVRACRKGAGREAANSPFAPSDHAEGNVLEDTVVGEEGSSLRSRLVPDPPASGGSQQDWCR